MSRPIEPYDPRDEGGPRWSLIGLAILVGLAVSFLAPDGWPEEPAQVTTLYRGALVDRVVVMVGEGTPVALAGRAEGAEVRVALAQGVPADQQTLATITVDRGNGPVRPALDEVEIKVTLADGREELVPAVRWDAAAGHLEAARRPPVDANAVLGLLGFVVVLWISEAIPLFVTSLLIPIVLVVAEIGTATDALAPFFHPIIALFFGGFLMAEAMRRVGLDHLAAISLVARAGRSPATLFAACMGVSAILSMFMSNTAATAVLVPIALALTEPIHHLGYRKALVLAIAYAATIGGVGSAIGTPANPLAIEFLESFAGKKISFIEWFAFGLPMVVVFLPIMGTYLWHRSRVDVDGAAFAAARRVATQELTKAGRPTRDQLLVLAVFGGVMLLWLTQTFHDLDTGIIAVMGAAVLAVLGKVIPADLGRISWASLLTFGGGLTLGFFLVESGTSDWLATRLSGLAGLPAIAGIAITALLALAMTTVASNTATAAMLVPLSIPLAGVLGVDPTTLVVVVAIASSIDFALVIGTPPTMIAYSTELYTTREIFGTGIALDAAGVLVLVTAIAAFWSIIGIV